jgi:adenylyl- and sulfurtransferase ThiI
VTKAVKGAVQGQVKNAINRAIGVKTPKSQSFGKQLTKNIGSQIAGRFVPKSVDISKLMAVPAKKRTAPLKANLSKLTPVSKISGLSTLIKGKG